LPFLVLASLAALLLLVFGVVLVLVALMMHLLAGIAMGWLPSSGGNGARSAGSSRGSPASRFASLGGRLRGFTVACCRHALLQRLEQRQHRHRLIGHPGSGGLVGDLGFDQGCQLFRAGIPIARPIERSAAHGNLFDGRVETW